MKRIFALVFVCLLVVSLLPVGVWAAEDAQPDKTVSIRTSMVRSGGSEIDVTRYSYAVAPVLAPFSRYIYVQTDNPDPASFRLVDKSSKYFSPGDKGEIWATRGDGSYSYGICEAGTYYIEQALFADVVYEDMSVWRVKGGYLFRNQNSEADGGQLVLQQITKRADSIINCRYADTDVVIDCPDFLSAKDYLIDACTDSTRSFFENMDALQAELDRIARYPRTLNDLSRPSTAYPYPLLFASCYEELPLDERYVMYKSHAYGLLLNHAYPFALNSLSFPGMLEAMAKMLASGATVKWTSIHYLIDVTYGGETRTYGGAGCGGTNPLYTDKVTKAFSFSGSSSDLGTHGAIEKYMGLYDAYEKAADTAAEQYRNLIRGDTFDKKIASTGGTWMRVVGWTSDPAFAYCVPLSQTDNFTASDAWVDGKYINKNEIMEPGAKYEDHPFADIILHDVSYTDRWGTAHRQDVMYSYDKSKDLWTAPFFYSAMCMYTLSDQLPAALILTPEQAEAAVRAMEPEKNSGAYPAKGLIYDGSVYPGTPFSNVSVTGVSMEETLSVVAGTWNPCMAVAVVPSNATYKDVIWSSSDETILCVGEREGGFFVSKTGEAQLVATTIDGQYTAACTVVVTPNIQFEQELDDAAVTEGETLTLQCSVLRLNSNGDVVQYQWQQSADAGTTWTDVAENGTQTALCITPVLADSGMMFRCRAWNSYGEIFTRAAALTVQPRPYVPTPIIIMTQPASVTADRGETAVFTVEATGENLTYAWYRKGLDDEDWMPVDGGAGPSLTVRASKDDCGSRYRCRLQSSTGEELFSDEVTLTVMTYPPVIETQPESVAVENGTWVAFTVAATGKDISWQWYGKGPEDADWTPIDGAVTNTLSLEASGANDGWRYRAQLQNEDGEATTAEATLTVLLYPPVITGQPRSVKVKNGAMAAFSVTATGKDLTYQWYGSYGDPASAEWDVIEGATSTTVSIVGSADNNGARYRCKVSNPDGEVTSEAAVLTVMLQPPEIRTQPRDVKVKSGSKAKFSVKATGKHLTYQWYSRLNEGDDWVELADENKAILSIVVSMAENGRQYRCRIRNVDGEVYSAEAALTVTPQPPAIRTQPKAAVTVKSGAKARISVRAAGPNLKYQWYKLAKGAEDWIEMAGQTKADCTFAATLADDGAQFRCRVWNDDEALTSNAAALHVTPAPVTIKTQPKDMTVSSGAKARISVKAAGPSLRYQWYCRASEGDDWTEIAGATKAACTVVASADNDGWQYCCRVWNADEEKWSDAATMTLK